MVWVQILIPGMSEVTALLLGMLVYGLILRGGWWLLNWRSRHPRPILAGNAAGTASAVVRNADLKTGLPAFFRMSKATQFILYVLLLSPPVAATILVADEWEGGFDTVLEVLVGFLHPGSLLLTCIVYLLCPYTAWNIYWRRRDFIKFDINQVEYRSAYKTGKLVPGSIEMFRGRSWRFDLIDLFRGQMASSWFLKIIPMTGIGKNRGNEGEEYVILDLKAMNLGGSAKSIAKLASQVYGDKFLISNELPASAG
jgi:hypothetical protein